MMSSAGPEYNTKVVVLCCVVLCCVVLCCVVLCCVVLCCVVLCCVAACCSVLLDCVVDALSMLLVLMLPASWSSSSLL